jgi:uncharacterized membrane protein YccC
MATSEEKPELSPKSLLLYIAKCMLGTGLIFLLSRLLQYPDIIWCLISLLLVLSPDSKEAIPLALTRIKANLIASIASLLCLAIDLPDAVTVCLAIALTIAFCYVFKVMEGSRSGVAAAVVVTLHIPATHFWDPALQRALSVVVGCTLGLLITFAFHRDLPRKSEPPATEPNKSPE